ncbi:MAG: hypothetical protein HBSAPP04_19500 [Ignavibacteriaceae bacterium]|nr:MAG: hypothetical protein EDM75_03960 [Chlorobiota bacterium]GJQ33111.1 MAG: hypothetical protein HBSAPP04_19500 [Ignavibacteriaceae bacterium]
MKYLTKSRFKLALKCLTKLYYTGKDEYADNSINDPFLEALADGGFQVGELAKYIFADDPSSSIIEVKTKNYEESLRVTSDALLGNEEVLLSEAAFRSGSLFVRVDILEKKGSVINIYEVKSKSIDGENIEFITRRGETKVKVSGSLICTILHFNSSSFPTLRRREITRSIPTSYSLIKARFVPLTV